MGLQVMFKGLLGVALLVKTAKALLRSLCAKAVRQVMPNGSRM